MSAPVFFGARDSSNSAIIDLLLCKDSVVSTREDLLRLRLQVTALEKALEKQTARTRRLEVRIAELTSRLDALPEKKRDAGTKRSAPYSEGKTVSASELQEYVHQLVGSKVGE